MKTLATHTTDCEQYCVHATDTQLHNIYRMERERAKNNPDTDVGRVAVVFAAAARAEMKRRGIWEGET